MGDPSPKSQFHSAIESLAGRKVPWKDVLSLKQTWSAVKSTLTAPNKQIVSVYVLEHKFSSVTIRLTI